MASTSHPQKVEVSDPSSTMDGSNDSEFYRTAEQTLYLDPVLSETMLESKESVRRSIIEERIERSKSHWSEISTVELDSNREVDGETGTSDLVDQELQRVKADNEVVFKILQLNPEWGGFFRTFGYELGVFGSSGELEIGEKFAEGGQAELFHAQIKWQNSEYNKTDLKEGNSKRRKKGIEQDKTFKIMTKTVISR